MKPYYDDGKGIVIYHGDCREILPTLEAGSVDLVLTDPPYWVGFRYGKITDLDMDYVDPEWLVQECRRLASFVLITPGNGNDSLYPAPFWRMGWFKPGSTGQSKLGGFSTFENILCYGKQPKRIYQDAISLSSVSNLNSDTLDHPCPKPLKLFTWLVDVASLDHAIVLDPFLGSGTTLVAAKLLGRRAIGIEIEEHYCEIAANRLRNTDLPLFEGLSPVLRQASFEAT